jgi:hypothetical protein
MLSMATLALPILRNLVAVSALLGLVVRHLGGSCGLIGLRLCCELLGGHWFFCSTDGMNEGICRRWCRRLVLNASWHPVDFTVLRVAVDGSGCLNRWRRWRW